MRIDLRWETGVIEGWRFWAYHNEIYVFSTSSDRAIEYTYLSFQLLIDVSRNQAPSWSCTAIQPAICCIQTVHHTLLVIRPWQILSNVVST